MRILYAATAALLLLLVANAFAATPEVRVKFKRGATSATIKGTIRGYETRDYLIAGRKGQHITIDLDSKKRYTFFTIQTINGMETQQIESTEFEEVLPEDRDYRIRVSMTRADARRKGAVAAYTLRVSIK
jgi:hypothetical protein